MSVFSRAGIYTGPTSSLDGALSTYHIVTDDDASGTFDYFGFAAMQFLSDGSIAAVGNVTASTGITASLNSNTKTGAMPTKWLSSVVSGAGDGWLFRWNVERINTSLNTGNYGGSMTGISSPANTWLRLGTGSTFQVSCSGEYTPSWGQRDVNFQIDLSKDGTTVLKTLYARINAIGND